MLNWYSKLLAIIVLNLFLVLPFYSEEWSGKVIAVKDGDTIEILVNTLPIRVRLYGIDCPEKSQAFGQRARQFTSDLIFGKIVKVKVKDTDRYGRSVGEVILPDGRILNYELVKAGLAWWYRQFSKDPLLKKYEDDARSKGLGLWADPDPKAPWDFRRGGISKRNKDYQKREVSAAQCKGTTKAGKRCTRRADQSEYCWQHRK